MDRKPDTVTFVVETTRNTVVDVDAYVAALTLSRETDDWLVESRATDQMGRAVKQEIPEDRVTPRLVAVQIWAEGEFVAEYSAENPDVVEEDDRTAIVIAAEAAGVSIPDTFADPLKSPYDEAYQRLFVDQSVPA